MRAGQAGVTFAAAEVAVTVVSPPARIDGPPQAQAQAGAGVGSG